jgi:hypothetical protein
MKGGSGCGRLISPTAPLGHGGFLDVLLLKLAINFQHVSFDSFPCRTKIVSEVILFLFGFLLTVGGFLKRKKRIFVHVDCVWYICSDFVLLSHFRGLI